MDLQKNLYKKDFYAWCFDQAECMLQGNMERLDLINLSEEIECLGRNQRHELKSRLIILFIHLLKYKFQPEYEDKSSWIDSIRTQRICLDTLIDLSPSLKYTLEEVAMAAYENAFPKAEKQMGKKIPDFYRVINTCFTCKDALTSEWFPE